MSSFKFRVQGVWESTSGVGFRRSRAAPRPRLPPAHRYQRVVTRWSRGGHAVVTRWSRGGHAVDTRWCVWGRKRGALALDLVGREQLRVCASRLQRDNRLRAYRDNRLRAYRDNRLRAYRDNRLRAYIDNRLRAYRDNRLRAPRETTDYEPNHMYPATFGREQLRVCARRLRTTQPYLRLIDFCITKL